MIVEEVKVVNPTKSSVTLQVARHEAVGWTANKTGDTVVYTKSFPSHISSLLSAVICSNAPGELTIARKREETLRFVCVVEQRELSSNMAMDTTPVLHELARVVLSKFSLLNKMVSLSVDIEHENAWRKLNVPTFYLSPSKAPNVLNGAHINATKYILLSNTKAPLLEESIPEDKRK
ncbi:unnamed protein product, partial [Strongylus vulgaris]